MFYLQYALHVAFLHKIYAFKLMFLHILEPPNLSYAGHILYIMDVLASCKQGYLCSCARYLHSYIPQYYYGHQLTFHELLRNTSVSAARSCPKKTFRISFPNRITQTKAWTYRTCGTRQVRVHTRLCCLLCLGVRQTSGMLPTAMRQGWCTHRHTRAWLRQVNDWRIKLVFLVIRIGNNSPCQGQAGRR